MNKAMFKPLFLGAISLFLAVTATYVFTYFMTADTTYARTVAFATWMFGHIFLAFNFRSEKTPLLKEGVLSNRVMLLWALLVVVVLFVGTNLAPVQAALQITSLQWMDWVLVLVVSFVATFWMEAAKLLGRKP
jgi:P-type Ca2+ transporter type 2C